MTITAEIDRSELEAFGAQLDHQFEGIKHEVQGAMADAYYDVVYGNIGETGVDRPFAWAPLSPGYAKAVGRSHATLFLNGQLLNAIKVDKSGRDEAVVSVSDNDCPYAVAHQYGYPPKRLPARPYFPFDPQTGETTLSTLATVQAAAELQLAISLKIRGLA